MSDTDIKIGLSPDEVIAALKQISDASKNLQKQMEDSLGVKASQAVNDLKDNAEKGTNQITKFFSNMGTRIKEDLKTAFDVSSIMAGANFAKQIGEGVKSVFDMERAFDRLNVRMGLSTKQMDDFKRAAGRATATNGVNLQEIQPGLMSAASNGIKDPAQMTMIAATLARAKQIDPSIGGGEGVTDSIFEIMRRQGLAKNGANYGSTMDAINGATATGNFKNSGDAASHISALAQYSSVNGMDTRQLAGLATVASQGGQSTQALLNQILEKGSDVDTGAQLNGTLGRNVFKNGKLDAAELAKVDPNQWGSSTILGKASGLDGANGGDLKVLIDTFKQNMPAFQDVVNGTDETAKQFEKVSQSWAYQTEKFKANLTETGREIGDSIVETGQGILHGSLGGVMSGGSHLLKSVNDNFGTLVGGAALTAGAGALMGGGIRGLLGGSLASASGTQKVYVTNASEISGGAGASGGLLNKGVIPLAVAAVAGEAVAWGVDKLHDMSTDASAEAAGSRQTMKAADSFNARNGTDLSYVDFAKAVHDGTLSALKAHGQAAPKTKPTPNYPERQ